MRSVVQWARAKYYTFPVFGHETDESGQAIRYRATVCIFGARRYRVKRDDEKDLEMLKNAITIFLTGGLAVCAGNAAAHAHLEKALPAADSKIADAREIRLTFSEAVEPKLSFIRLETAEERTVTEPGAEPDPADPKVLVVHFYEKLPPGNYKVKWSVVAADGHKSSGSYSFLSSR